MKRKFTFLMAAIMTTSCMQVAVHAANFYDINEVPWEGAKTYVGNVADLGLMVGDIHPKTGKLRFRPKEKVTYCETTQLAYTILKKTNNLKVSDTNLVSKWTYVMKSYNIPTWAYEPVAYALENNIISLTDVSRFETKTGTVVKDNIASRESVAVIFGKSLSGLYKIDQNPTLTFGDKASIAQTSAPYVELLSRLGILVGDTEKNFTPKAPINRSEMAVIVSKTYETVSGGTTVTPPPAVDQTSEFSGTISSIEQYGDNKLLSVSSATGQRQGFMINQTTFALQGDTSVQVDVSTLRVGDTVKVSYSGSKVNVIRLMNKGVAQSSEVIGTINEITNKVIYIANNKTGKEERYDTADGYSITVNDKTKTQKEFLEICDENIVKATLTVDVTGYITGVKATTEESSAYIGTLISIYDDEISYKKTNSSSTETFEWSSRATILLEDKDSSVSKIKDRLKSETLYVKFYVDSKDRITKLMASTDKFSGNKDTDREVYGTVESLSSDSVKIKKSSDKLKTQYDFASSVSYYLDGEDSNYRKVSGAYEDAYDEDKTFYVKIVKNSSDEVTKFYVSTNESYIDGGSYKSTKDGILVWLERDSIRIDEDGGKKTYDLADDHYYYLDGKSSSLRDVEDAFDIAQDKENDFYITLSLDRDEEVSKIEASTSRSSSSNSTSGEIKSLSKSSISLKTGGSRDISSSVDVTLDDSDITLSKLINATDDSYRKFSADLTVKSGEVKKINAYTTEAEGTLQELDVRGKTIQIDTRDEDGLEYTLKGTNVECTGDYKTLRELDAAFYAGDDFRVILEFKEGEVVKINNRID